MPYIRIPLEDGRKIKTIIMMETDFCHWQVVFAMLNSVEILFRHEPEHGLQLLMRK